MKQTVLVLSCEHAVDTIPSEYSALFQEPLSHADERKSMDQGALNITKQISQQLNCPYTQSTVSRLLIDCNRSLSHSRCFSKYTKSLPFIEKQQLIDQYYTPFREQTQRLIETHIQNDQQVLHLSIHTFAPVLKGFRQNAGIGLLYNSKRHGEKEVARIWHGLLLQETPDYRIRYNYPFPGDSNSFTKSLRRLYPEKDYLGIEVEINQLLLSTPETEKEVAFALANSLHELIALL